MIKEAIFALTLQSADVASSYYVMKHNRATRELNPNLPLTSAISVVGVTYGLSSIHNKKWKIVVGGILVVGKGIIIYENLRKLK